MILQKDKALFNFQETFSGASTSIKTSSRAISYIPRSHSLLTKIFHISLAFHIVRL